MLPGTANNTGNPAPTGSLNNPDSPDAGGFMELLVSGTELSSDGLDELAALLLKLGRPNERPNSRQSGRR